MKRGALILLLVLSLSFIAADSIPLYVAPLNSTGHLQANTAFRYDINFSSGDCVSGPFVVNHTESISTNAAGIGFINVTFTTPSATPTLICQFQNGTLRSILPLSSQFFSNVFAQTLNTTGNVTSNWFVGKINASFIQNAPWSTSSGGNTSWNQSYANTLYHAINSQLGNTTSQIFVAVDNGTFLKISQWNATNISYLRTDQWNATNTSYLLIDRFNTTNTSYRTRDNGTFIINISTISSMLADNICYTNGTNCPAAGVGDITAIYTLNNFISLNNTDANDIYLNFNITHLNLTTDLRYFTKAQWNVTNSSYLMIDRFNTTNTSYRTLINGTYLNLWNVTGNVIINETSVMIISQWNATNLSYLLIDRFNTTNTTYRTLDNLTFANGISILGNLTGAGFVNSTNLFPGAINATHIPLGTINATHITGFIINSTHINYGEINQTRLALFLINNSHITASTINSSQILAFSINASRIAVGSINNSHIQGLSINATQIEFGAINTTRIALMSINSSQLQTASVNASALDINTVNTTHITANTIDASDLSTSVNDTYRLKSNHTFTGNVNITTQNVTFSNPTVLNISSNGTCVMIWGSTSRFEIC